MFTTFYINRYLVKEHKEKQKTKQEDYECIITKETKVKCLKTNSSINLRHNFLSTVINPDNNNDGFDCSRSFDYIQINNNNTIYINIIDCKNSNKYLFKELYRCIEAQLNIAKKTKNIYFANIIDENEIIKYMLKFNYLLLLEDYRDIRHNIFIGNISDYLKWFYLV